MGPPLPVNFKLLGTCFLIVGALAIMDPKNKGVPPSLQPVVVGLLILTVELAVGSNCGVPLNPARDLGPRLFTYIAGWGPEVFRWEMAFLGTHLPLLGTLSWVPSSLLLNSSRGLLGQHASSKTQFSPLPGPPYPLHPFHRCSKIQRSCSWTHTTSWGISELISKMGLFR